MEAKHGYEGQEDKNTLFQASKSIELNNSAKDPIIPLDSVGHSTSHFRYPKCVDAAGWYPRILQEISARVGLPFVSLCRPKFFVLWIRL